MKLAIASTEWNDAVKNLPATIKLIKPHPTKLTLAQKRQKQNIVAEITKQRANGRR